MPVPEPTRRSDLSAIPSFLRKLGGDAPTPADATPTAPATRRALPRPTTPAERPDDARIDPPLDPASLPMPSLSRRRVVTAAGVLLAGLLTLSFVRQVGEATAASDRAAELRAANAALRDEVARLQLDVGHVQDLHFIQLQGRAFGLGGKGEIPFALGAGASALEANAAGSAAVRLGAPVRPTSPLDAWLEVLFGAGG
ncbi:MAG: hypothetical protein E6I65_07700 [Chloroflexi bacterium]|nr:MAG: hypothetical protein E6I65_07700 [Chloroflexota bacterium]